MSKKDFVAYITSKGCEALPFEGVNTSANQIEFVNKKLPTSKFYLSSPFGEKAMSPKVIELACTRLGIPLPAHYD